MNKYWSPESRRILLFFLFMFAVMCMRIFMFALCINDIQTLCHPTNAQYIIYRYNQNCKIFKSAPTCFGSQRIHHQGALDSTWLKLQERFYRVRWHGRGQCYGSIIWPVVRVCSSLYRKVRICCYVTNRMHVNGHDRTILVILAKYCTWLPDDWSSVIRNISEQF